MSSTKVVQIMPLGSKLTTNGNLTKLKRNGPWVVFYQNCSNGSDWLHMKVRGSKKGFQKAMFKNLL